MSEATKFNENSGKIDFKIFKKSLFDINNILEDLNDDELKKIVGQNVQIDQKKKVMDLLNL